MNTSTEFIKLPRDVTGSLNPTDTKNGIKRFQLNVGGRGMSAYVEVSGKSRKTCTVAWSPGTFDCDWETDTIIRRRLHAVGLNRRLSAYCHANVDDDIPEGCVLHHGAHRGCVELLPRKLLPGFLRIVDSAFNDALSAPFDTANPLDSSGDPHPNADLTETDGLTFDEVCELKAIERQDCEA